MEKKQNKIIFTKEIDDAISGYTLAITFILIGIFLLNNLNYFGNKIVSIIILSIFTLIGIVGTFVELGKNETIKGLDDFGIGIGFFIPWIILYIFVNKIWINCLGFILLLIGIYGIVSGIIKILVSLFYNKDNNDNKLKKLFLNLLKILPAIASFILVIFNIIKIIFEIKNF